MELNGDLIISTNGVLEIHDVSYIGIPQGSGHKVILNNKFKTCYYRWWLEVIHFYQHL